LKQGDLERYAYFDSYKQYTRNLVATDNESYTLLLLCWNPQKESKVHDHPCDGCYVRVVQGQVRECRYRLVQSDEGGTDEKEGGEGDTLRLVCTQDQVFGAGDGICFIEDSQGYHKVGDASAVDTSAVAPDGSEKGSSACGGGGAGSAHHRDLPAPPPPGAVTMHLYTPPFSSCKIWLDENCSKSSQSCVCFYSEYGVKVRIETPNAAIVRVRTPQK